MCGIWLISLHLNSIAEAWARTLDPHLNPEAWLGFA